MHAVTTVTPSTLEHPCCMSSSWGYWFRVRVLHFFFCCILVIVIASWWGCGGGRGIPSQGGFQFLVIQVREGYSFWFRAAGFHFFWFHLGVILNLLVVFFFL